MEKKRREPAPNPNYTQSPNVFYDDWLREIKSLSELKVVEIVIRYTFGWHASEVLLTLTAIEFLTGLSRVSAQDGVERALNDGYIVPVKRGKSFSYRLNVETKETDNMLEIIQAVAFVKSSDGLSPEKVNLRNSLSMTGKESIPMIGKESIPVKKAIGKESIQIIGKESIPSTGKESLPPYKDKEKKKENRKKEEITTTTSSTPSPSRDLPLSARPIPVPDPYHITLDERTWAAANCPLVDLEDETYRFISRNTGSDPKHVKPADVPLDEWRRRWRMWIRKGQKFATRDAAQPAATSNKNGNGAATSASQSKKQKAHAVVADFLTKHEPKGTTDGQP
jgi:hypothetical protein